MRADPGTSGAVELGAVTGAVDRHVGGHQDVTSLVVNRAQASVPNTAT